MTAKKSVFIDNMQRYHDMDTPTVLTSGHIHPHKNSTTDFVTTITLISQEHRSCLIQPKVRRKYSKDIKTFIVSCDVIDNVLSDKNEC